MADTQRYYTESHEWLELRDDGSVRIGITNHAAEQLGEIVFVELPSEGQEISQGDGVGVIESVKAAADVVAPISGKIANVNTAVADDNSLLAEDPESEGWLFSVLPSDSFTPGDHLSHEDYNRLIAGES